MGLFSLSYPNPQTHLPVHGPSFPFFLLNPPKGTCSIQRWASSGLHWIPFHLPPFKPGSADFYCKGPDSETWGLVGCKFSITTQGWSGSVKAMHSRKPSGCGCVKLYLQKQMLGWTEGPRLLIPGQGTCLFIHPFSLHSPFPSSLLTALQKNP